MKIKPILLVAGEPKSIFLEIFFKSIKNIKYKSPLILICSKKVLENQIKKFRFKKKIKVLSWKNLNNFKINNQKINIIDVELETAINKKLKIKFQNEYINNCFKIAFQLVRDGYTYKFINGPINKKTFLNKNYLGITEYISKKLKIKKTAMLIYNKELSVCPLTTHLPLKHVTKKINKKNIIEKVELIHEFYKSKIKKRAKIAVVGLNPHCESVDKFNEDEKIIYPTIKYLKKLNYKISGPYPADTIFLKKNRKKYNVILGMYHDQVLTPIKTLFEYDAINITLGLPFTRISPDHGPNEKMLGKNTSNPLSLIKAISFLDKN